MFNFLFYRANHKTRATENTTIKIKLTFVVNLLPYSMSSNKFDALVVSDDSDNSDGNMGDSGNLTGKNNRKV